MYINDITDEVLHANIRLFADDTCLFIDVDNRNIAANHLNDDLERINLWSKKWLVSFSPHKTKSLIISNKQDSALNPPVYLNNSQIEEVKNYTYLGMMFSHNLKWNKHIDGVALKARQRLTAMFPLKFVLDRMSLQTMYFSFVRPVMDYGNVVWGGSYDSDLFKLERINIAAMRLITGATGNSNTNNLYIETEWSNIRDRAEAAMIIMLFKTINSLRRTYLEVLLPQPNQRYIEYNLRNKDHIRLPFTRLELFRRSFLPTAIRLWNNLTLEQRSVTTLSQFKDCIRTMSPEPQIIYFYGKRWPSVHHARLRMGCSNLNFDLCYKAHVINDPSCQCGERFETAEHFFLECARYQNIRLHLIDKINSVKPCSLDLMLFGDKTLPKNANQYIFDAVHCYIEESKRFS